MHMLYIINMIMNVYIYIHAYDPLTTYSKNYGVASNVFTHLRSTCKSMRCVQAKMFEHQSVPLKQVDT